jgi:hypothetical protein
MGAHNASDPFEILGYVIFFEYIFTLDEDMVSTPWWDEGKRFLKTGVAEMIMKSTLRREYTTTRSLFMNTLGVTLTEKE